VLDLFLERPFYLFDLAMQAGLDQLDFFVQPRFYLLDFFL